MKYFFVDEGQILDSKDFVRTSEIVMNSIPDKGEDRTIFKQPRSRIVWYTIVKSLQNCRYQNKLFRISKKISKNLRSLCRRSTMDDRGSSYDHDDNFGITWTYWKIEHNGIRKKLLNRWKFILYKCFKQWDFYQLKWFSVYSCKSDFKVRSYLPIKSRNRWTTGSPSSRRSWSRSSLPIVEIVEGDR